MIEQIQEPAPHSIEAEQSVLGAIIIDPEAVVAASDIISAQDFYSEAHRKIYGACLDCMQLEGTIDLVLLVERLRHNGELDSVGGGQYLANIVASTPTAANVKYHSKIIKEKSTLRKMMAHSMDVYWDARNGESSEAIMKKMEAGTLDILEAESEKKSPDITSILDSVNRQWKLEMSGEANNYIETDNKLHSAIPRYARGHLWVVGGYTSTGKSTFMNQLICDIGKKGGKSMVFSTEDSRETKVIKMLSNLADIDQRRLLTADISSKEMSNLMELQTVLKIWDVAVYDDIDTVEKIRLKVKKAKMSGKVDVVFLDYAQNLSYVGSLYEGMSHAAKSLFKMAGELDVTVVVLSQVSNESMKTDSDIIGLKGAGELAAAADIVLWLKREKGAGNERALNCEIRKNRPYGVTGVQRLCFSTQYTRVMKAA